MSLYTITAVGPDRPGMVADVTEGLSKAKANLEDAAMQTVGGQFAVSFLVETDVTLGELEEIISDSVSDMDVRVREATTAPRASAPTHVYTVYGADRPGLVHAGAVILRDSGANITNLQSRILESDSPIYVMAFEVNLPESVEPEDICNTFRENLSGVEVSVNAYSGARM